MGKSKRRKSGFRKSSSLPSRSTNKNIENLVNYRNVETPVQVDRDRVHHVLRDLKASAIEIKATFKKNEKKKKTEGIEELRFLARSLGSQIRELYMLLGIQEGRRHSSSSGRRKSIDDTQLQFPGRSDIQDLNACRRCRQLEERNKQITKDEQEASERCRQLEEQNKKITSEKDEALTRLSQIAGSKLRENNPAIADLSDPNRPMKLSEKVSELYDNEWTEAAESLEKFDENIQYISLLRDIFVESYKLCMETADKYLNDLYQLITYARRHQHSGYESSIPTDVKQKCKEFRKSIAETTISSLNLQDRLWYYVEGKHGETVATLCSEYIGKCVKYSWYMSIQDPPIHMEYGYTEGDKFVSDLMRAYTKTGPRIEFLVWPALHLHRNGPLLSKAIVQGSNIQKKDPPQPKTAGNMALRYGERHVYRPLENVPVPYHVEKKGVDVPLLQNPDNMDDRNMKVSTYNGKNQKSGPQVYINDQEHQRSLEPSKYKSSQDRHQKLDQSVYKSNQDRQQKLDHPVYKSNQDRQQQLDQSVYNSKHAPYRDQRYQGFNQTYYPSSGRSHHQRNSQHNWQSQTPQMYRIPNQTYNYSKRETAPHETVL